VSAAAASDGPGSGLSSRTSLRRDGSYHRHLATANDVEAHTAASRGGGSQKNGGDAGRGQEAEEYDAERDEDGLGWRRWFYCCGRGGGARRPPTGGFLVQTEALSRRLLLRAVRHPLLLVLHFGGSLAMAVCLGTIFQGKLDFTFEGAQSRYIRAM